MDEILLQALELKNMIINSDEYKEFSKCEKIIDDNDEIKNIINEIKKKQKIIINKEARNIDKEKEEFEVKNLFKKLESYEEYNNYIKSAKVLNSLISDIQKRFTEYFNEFVL